MFELNEFVAQECAEVPTPLVLRLSELRRSPQASTGRQRGEETEALTASAPVAGGLITDMVWFVKVSPNYRLAKSPADCDAGPRSDATIDFCWSMRTMQL